MVHIPSFDLLNHPTWQIYLGMVFFTLCAALFLVHSLAIGFKMGAQTKEPAPITLRESDLEQVSEARLQLYEIQTQKHEREKTPDPITGISSFFGAIAFLWTGTRPCILEMIRRRRKGALERR